MGDSDLIALGRAPETSEQVRRLAAVLLNQQMWCWGCDIRRPAGNVLLQHGFERWRPPEGTIGCTVYQRDLPPDQQVVLWGFGLFFGDRSDGGLYLKRYTFAPLLTKAYDLRAALWRPEDLPELRPPETGAEQTSLLRLLASALRWIAAYEAWVLTNLGLDYRQQCLLEWPKSVTEAGEVPGQWLHFAEHCSELLALGAGERGVSG